MKYRLAFPALGAWLALCLLPIPPADAASGSLVTLVLADASSPLARARALYDASRFQEAADSLGAAIRGGEVGGDDLNEARALRSRCLAKAGRALEAKEGFKSVLRSDAMYRLDPNQVPPDEMAVFQLALREFQADQVEAGRRAPASIAFSIGAGNAVNQDLADLASSAGVEAADDFSEKPEFSYSVRLPLRPRMSIEFEVTRLRAETADQLPAARNAHATYTATALPFTAGLVRNLWQWPRRRVNVIAAVGPAQTEAIIEYKQSLVGGRIIPTQIVGHNLGWAFLGGLEGEWLPRPRLAVTARVAARRVNSGRLEWPRDDFEVYESFPQSKLGERTIDFSGISASVGVRAYIGY